MKTTLLLVSALIVLTSAWACGPPAHANETEATKLPPSQIQRLTFLSPEVSRSLKIAQVPTDQPVALLIGTYWDCEMHSIGGPPLQDEDDAVRVEVCDLVTVVCDNNQTNCVQLP